MFSQCRQCLGVVMDIYRHRDLRDWAVDVHVVVHHKLIEAMCAHGELDKSVTEFESLLQTLSETDSRKAVPYRRTFRLFLVACALGPNPAVGERVLELAKDFRVPSSPKFLRAQLFLYVACGRTEQASDVLHQLKQHGVTPVDAYNFITDGYAHAGKLEEALKLMENNSNIEWNAESFIPLLNACKTKDTLTVAERVHELAQRRKIWQGPEYKAALKGMHERCGEQDKAKAPA